MRARVLHTFRDVREGIRRTPGTEFELTEERFAEIEARLPGYVERVAEAPAEAPKKPKRPARAKKTAEADETAE